MEKGIFGTTAILPTNSHIIDKLSDMFEIKLTITYLTMVGT